jgi:ketosteroid isomerase-like protein
MSVPDAFPRVLPHSSVAPAEIASAVDFVNRVNWLFETWDVDAMVRSFTPDAVAYHFHGTIRGEAEIRRFFEQDYPYLVPGVGRHATSHIVDTDGDGVQVRYHNLLVRHSRPADAPALGAGQVMDSLDLPALWLYSPMRDRLVRTPEGWKIRERYIGGSTTNVHLNPVDASVEAISPYLPRIGF